MEGYKAELFYLIVSYAPSSSSDGLQPLLNLWLHPKTFSTVFYCSYYLLYLFGRILVPFRDENCLLGTRTQRFPLISFTSYDFALNIPSLERPLASILYFTHIFVKWVLFILLQIYSTFIFSFFLFGLLVNISLFTIAFVLLFLSSSCGFYPFHNRITILVA